MFRPVSMTNNMTSFKGYTIVGGDDKSEKKITSPDNKEKLDKAMSSSIEREKIALQNGLMAGMFFGTILATTGTAIYKDNQINNLMKDIAAESTYEGVDSFKVEDVNSDEVPEFILIDKNGDKTAYDFTTGKIYFDEDGELIEKMQ